VVATELRSDPAVGLSAPEVERRRAEHGPNVLTARRGHGPLVRFLLQFHQPLVYILLAAVAVTAAFAEWVDSGVILGVVLVNAIVGFVQETRAVKAIEALAKSVAAEATVVRDGHRARVPAADLVPGDLVLIQSGDKVPADLRLMRVRELKTEEAALTGESVPVEKSADPVGEDASVGDRKCVAFASTLVTYGTAAGLVVATGDHTEVGRIARLIHSADDLATPLTRQISRFSRWLLVVILALSAVTVAIGLARGQGFAEVFLAAVALAVGAIPEGLPAAVTITLAVGVWRMSRRNAIIRKLPAVETLGSTTVICSDKTGTLTENQMTVQRVFDGSRWYDVSGTGYDPAGRITTPDTSTPAGESPALAECLLAGALCNEARLFEKDGRWTIEGDPTEAALLVAARKFDPAADRWADDRPRVDSLPFESAHQYMATLHDTGPHAPRVVYLKGSVEQVLRRCDAMYDRDGRPTPVVPDLIHSAANDMAAAGLRVLAFARADVPANLDRVNHRTVDGGLTFVGLMGMIDPPRGEAIAAADKCKAAGVRVVMITGDHPLTAAAVAERLGLNTGRGGRPLVYTGAQVSGMTDAEVAASVTDADVYARVSPEQKLGLVKAFQTAGHVAAMTGDGVNDAPALKQADIGIAMGMTGTDVAKESADMVLTDDNFASIVAAVEEGRSIFDNLTKFILWTLPTNLGEGLVILAGIAMGTTLPILPVQILWINMTTAVLLGLTLVFEAKEPGLMARRPRDPAAPILSGVLIERLVMVSVVLLVAAFGLFKWIVLSGQPEVEAGGLTQEGLEAKARTAAVNVFVVVEAFYLFNCRSLTRPWWSVGVFSNPTLWGGVGLMVALQLLFTYAPFMNAAFHSAPIGWVEWGWCVLAGVTCSLLVGAEKWLRAVLASRRGRNHTPAGGER
jgi:Ca2+-transporting ATPase